MALATLPAELIRLIVETAELEPASITHVDGGGLNEDAFELVGSNYGSDEEISNNKTVILPLNPEFVSQHQAPDGQQLRRLLNLRDLHALAQSCRHVGFVIIGLLYEANREFQNSSAVFWAAAAGRTETLARAMQCGLNIDDSLTTDRSLSPVWADAGGREETLARALQYKFMTEDSITMQRGLPPLASSLGLDNYHEWRPVQIALKFGHHDTMEWLLDHGAELDVPVKHNEHEELPFDIARSGSSLLFMALEQGKEDVSVRLIQRGGRLLFGLMDSPVTESALHLAAQACFEDTMELLMRDYGMNPNLAVGWGWPSTPLNDAAARDNSVAIIDTLLRHGADIDESGKCSCENPDCERRKPDEQTPLEVALIQRQYSNAFILLERGARVNSERITHIVARYCPVGGDEGLKVLGMLLRDHGVNMNVPDPKFKMTALGDAAWRGDESLVEFLLKNGADPDHPSGWNRDLPLYLASTKADYNFHARIVGLLLDHGADPNYYVDKKRQQTWLQTVATYMVTDSLQQLLEVLHGRGLDLPWRRLRLRANGPPSDTRAVSLHDNDAPYV